jgi:hypothetical protein
MELLDFGKYILLADELLNRSTRYYTVNNVKMPTFTLKVTETGSTTSSSTSKTTTSSSTTSGTTTSSTTTSGTTTSGTTTSNTAP